MSKSNIVLYAILILFALWTILPPLITLETSFLKTYAFINPLEAIRRFNLDNWRYLPYDRILRWSLNSLIVCGTSMVVGVLVCVLAGYGFAKYDFPGKEPVFMLFLLGMMIPATVLFLPQFLIVSDLGMFDSYAGMIAPMLIYPAGVFFARQYMAGLPTEILEAARVDGAGELRIFWTIVRPLSMPLIAVLSLFIFVYTWQQFLWQFIIVRDIESMTLMVGLGMLLRGMAAGGLTVGLSEHSPVSIEGLQAAGSVILAIPPLVIFLLGESRGYFTKGLVAGSVKQ